jgi:hypothetical protein
MGLRSSRRGSLPPSRLNYGVAQERWLPVDAIETVDDPFVADVQLMHFGIHDPLARRSCRGQASARQDMIHSASHRRGRK